jgi:hypothetical protein
VRRWLLCGVCIVHQLEERQIDMDRKMLFILAVLFLLALVGLFTEAWKLLSAALAIAGVVALPRLMIGARNKSAEREADERLIHEMVGDYTRKELRDFQAAENAARERLVHPDMVYKFSDDEKKGK